MPSRASCSTPIAYFLRVAGLVCVLVMAAANNLRAQDSVSVAGVCAEPTRPAATTDSLSFKPLTLGEKAAFYSRRTFSLRAVLGASYAAGLAQWRGTPREWGAGMSGYARRDAAAYGGGIVRRTTEFTIGALLHEDPRSERSARNGFVARTEDVLRNTVTIRTDDGDHRIAWSRAAAAIATGFAVNSWEPRRLHSTHHALMLSLAGFVSYGTANFTQEFTPDVKRYVLHQLHIGDPQ